MRGRFWILGLLVVVAGVAWWLLRDHAPTRASDAVPGSAEAGARPSPGAHAVADPSLRGSAEAKDGARDPRATPFARGRVIDASGAAVADIEVVALLPPPREWHLDQTFRALRRLTRPLLSPFPVAARATTDRAGRFALYDLDRATHYRIETRPQAGRGRAFAAPLGYPPYEQEFILVLPEGSDLRLRVVDEGGDGIPAGIEIWSQRPWGSLTTDVTDAQGRLLVRGVPHGPLRVYVRVPGRGTRSYLVAAPAEDEVLLRLTSPAGASVAGHVRAADDTPIEGAAVLASVYPEDRAEGDWAQLGARSMADGAYRIEGLPAGRVGDVAAWAPDYLPAKHGAGNAPLHAGETYEADLVLPPGLALTGHVQSEDGTSLEGVRVLAMAGKSKADAVSDAAGTVRLEPLPRAPILITAWREGWYLPEQAGGRLEGTAPRALRLPADAEQRSFVLVMRRGHVLRGRCVDKAGRGLAGIAVRGVPDPRSMPDTALLWDRIAVCAVTAPDGSFRLPGIPPATSWTLEARSDEHLGQLGPIGPWAADAEPEEIVFTLAPAARVSGRVVDEAGAPVAAVGVRLPNRDGDTRTDPEGAFAIGGLEARSHRLRVVDGSVELAELRVDGLAPGEHREGLELVVPRRLHLAGRVVTATGEPAAYAPLQLLPVDPTRGRRIQTSADGRGRFAVDVWGAGPYRAAVGTTKIPTEVTAGTGEVRLVLPADLPPLTVHIVDVGGAPVPKARLSFEKVMADGGSLSGGYEVDGGTYEFSSAGRAGLVRITVDRPADADGNPLALLREVVAVEESDRTITVRLAGGLRIAGTLRDDRGAAIEGQRVTARRLSDTSEWRTVATDAEGRFVIEPLAEGAHRVTWGGKAPWLPPEPIEVPAGSEGLDLRLTRGASFVVEVRDPEGNGLPAVRVLVTTNWEERRVQRQGETDEDGRFEAEGVPAGALLEISASTTPRTGAAYPTVRLEDVPFRTGSVVVPMVEGVFVEGEVVSPEGAPVTTGRVKAEDAKRRRASSVQLEGGSNVFRLGPLLPGRYRVVAAGPRGTAPSESVEIDAPADGLRLVLRHRTTITGRLLDPEGKTWTAEWLTKDMAWGGRVNPDGRFAFKDVYAGPGSLFLREQEGSRVVLLEDVDPTAASFEVTATEGHTLQGRVVGEGASLVGLRRGLVYLGGPVQDDGTFEIRGVPDGTWTLTVWGRETVLVEREGVPANATDLVLERP